MKNIELNNHDGIKNMRLRQLINNKNIRSTYVVFSRKAVLLTIFSCSFYTQAQDLVISAGKSGSISTPINATINLSPPADRTAYLDWGYALFYGLRIAGASTGVGGYDCLNYSSNFTTTSDGVWGYKLGNDVVMTFDGEMKGTVTYTGGSKSQHSTFSSSTGYVGWNNSTVPTFCAGYNALGLAGSTVTISKSGTNTSSFQGSIGIYAGPNAAVGTYTTPTVELIQAIDGSVSGYYASKMLSVAGTVRVVPELVCSVNAPPTIDFGSVNIQGLGSGVLLAHKNQDLILDCTGDSRLTQTMTVKFNGDYEGGYFGRLSVSDTTGRLLGYIRARYLNDGGTCSADTTNEVTFNESKPRITQAKAGQVVVPITWSLCTNGSGLYGEGSAQATASVTWE